MAAAVGEVAAAAAAAGMEGCIISLSGGVLLGDVLLHILQSLLLKELGRAAQVSKFWQSVADCDSLWEALCLRTPFYRLMGAMKETRPDIGYKALYVQRRKFITFSNLFPSPAV